MRSSACTHRLTHISLRTPACTHQPARIGRRTSADAHQHARIGRRTSALHASAGMHRHLRFTGVKNVLVHAPLSQCAPVSLMSYPLALHCATDCMRAACLHLPCMRRLRHAPARTSSVPAPPVKYAGLPRPHSPRSAHAMTATRPHSRSDRPPRALLSSRRRALCLCIRAPARRAHTYVAHNQSQQRRDWSRRTSPGPPPEPLAARAGWPRHARPHPA